MVAIKTVLFIVATTTVIGIASLILTLILDAIVKLWKKTRSWINRDTRR